MAARSASTCILALLDRLDMAAVNVMGVPFIKPGEQFCSEGKSGNCGTEAPTSVSLIWEDDAWEELFFVTWASMCDLSLAIVGWAPQPVLWMAGFNISISYVTV